jgi:hypothetical protein
MHNLKRNEDETVKLTNVSDGELSPTIFGRSKFRDSRHV